ASIARRTACATSLHGCIAPPPRGLPPKPGEPLGRLRQHPEHRHARPHPAAHTSSRSRTSPTPPFAVEIDLAPPPVLDRCRNRSRTSPSPPSPPETSPPTARTPLAAPEIDPAPRNAAGCTGYDQRGWWGTRSGRDRRERARCRRARRR